MQNACKKMLAVLGKLFFALFCSAVVNIFKRSSLTKRLYMSYNGKDISDGIGAQLQRILSVAALSNYINASYVHSGIVNLTIQPLDPYQDEISKNTYIDKINNYFNIQGVNSPSKVGKFIELKVLKPIYLLRILVNIHLTRKPIYLKVSEVYPIIDYLPYIYERIKYLSLPNLINLLSKVNLYSIALHFRSGTIKYANYHKQLVSRYLPLSYFLNILDQCSENKKIGSSICVTDSPKLSFTFTPQGDEVINWSQMPGFNNGSVEIESTDLNDLQIRNVSIVRGGDPLESLAILIKADTLIMSRSSFSYVAGLLSKSHRIYYPPNFWHPKLNSWLEFNPKIGKIS